MAELSRGQILKNPEILGIGNTGAAIRLLDADENSYVDLKVPDTVGTAYTFTLPSNSGTDGYILKTNGQGTSSWVQNIADPGGTSGSIQYNSSETLSGAAATTDGTNIFLTSAAQVRFNDADNSNYVGIAASNSVTGNRNYILPDTIGTVGQVLKIATRTDDNNASLVWAIDNTSEAGALIGGSDTFVQFNDGGLFGGNLGFKYNKSTYRVDIVGLTSAAGGFNAGTGSDYEINNVSVLTSTTLGSGVVNSSLTSVGTLTILNVDNLQFDLNTFSSTVDDVIISPAGNLRLASNKALRFYDSDNTNYVGLIGPSAVTSDFTLTLPAVSGSADEIIAYNASGVGAFVSNLRTLNFIIDGGGELLTSGEKGFVVLDFDCEITGWTILADQVGTISIDIRRSTYAAFPPVAGQSILGTSPNREAPTLSTTQKNQDYSLTNLVGICTAGDVLSFVVDASPAPVAVTRVVVALRLRVR